MKILLGKKWLLVTAIEFLLTTFASGAGGIVSDTASPGNTNLKYVDPTIGNVAQLLEPTRPTSYLPNQLIRVYPIRKDYIDDQISSFPLTAVSHRLGEAFSIKPIASTVDVNSWKKKLLYDHDLETTKPWYYSAYLPEEGVTVEFTPGKKTGYYRFSFHKDGGTKAILLGVYNDGDSYWHFKGNNIIEGMETYHGDIKIYTYGVFSVAGSVGVLENGELKSVPETFGKSARAFINFPSDTRSVELKYSISFISAEQAKMNFQKEISKKNFVSMKKNAVDSWLVVLNQIQVEGGTDAEKRSFYTALYRCYERMVNITEDSNYYSGFNHSINKSGEDFYVDDWSWDTYLALHPLRMILHPAQEQNMLRSYITMYQQSKWMPTFPVLFGDHACMNGFHSSIIFLDAYRKGLRDFDVEKAYEGMKKNAMEATLLPWRNGNKTLLDDFYQSNGYFPALHPGEKETISQVHPFEKRQAVAVTLGASFDDWAVGQLAKELGKAADYTLFSKRGKNYVNLWNQESKFFLPKDSAGNWINIDPKFDGGPGGRDYFDENNGWTYLWQVQEDIPGLIDLMGGKKNFEERLDQLFREDLGRSKYEFWNKFPDASGLVGQYSMGNEPSFHIPYLYNYTNAPWKTQKIIRLLLSLWFKDNVFGIPGDEDGGGMSAFVVFSSMGFYPITPGLPVYTIGSPVFNKITINLTNGKKFRVIAHNCSGVNKYIQSATFDGKAISTPWFTHKQLVNGGILELIMGPRPNQYWGVVQ
jgi:predicted alpha-1,2-mannosidase